jgi:ABC-type spermidine/putrescine transport system permease subunit II
VRSWLIGTRGGSWSDRAIAIWSAAVYVFLYAPIVTAVVYSFNQGVLGKQSANFTGATTSWYTAAWTDPTLRHTVAVSVRVALLVAAISLVLGTITGIAITRHPSRLVRISLEVMVLMLLIVPEVVLAVSLLLFYTKTGIALGTLTLVAAHTPFTIAIVAIIVRSRVVALNRTLEDAAADLGAGPWQTMRDVILPQLRPALIACVILAFTFSFDDLATSEFLTTPTVSTLPVYLFGTLHSGTTPEVYAAASMMLGFTLTLLFLAWLIYRRQSVRLRRRAPVLAPDQLVAVGQST